METDKEDNTSGPSTSSNETATFSFIESSHGGRILVKSGRRHYLKRVNEKSGTAVWNCHKKMCSGLIVLGAGENHITREMEHSCVPDYESIEIEKSFISLKKKTCTDYKPIPLLYKQEMKKYMSEEYVHKLPTFSKKKRTLYRARNSEASINCNSIRIPETLAEDWLCINDNDMLVFVTTQAKDWMKNCKTYFSDGTFNVVPKPFTQLYTIHCDIGSDADSTKVVPCIFALLPNKCTETYIRLFQSIKDEIPNFQPVEIKMDYETAAINAVREIYPSTKISGCFFHYSQAIFKKGESLNILEQPGGYKYLTKCVALAHLPSLKIHEGWFLLMSEAPIIANIDLFNKYMAAQWVNVKMIQLMSCYGQRHRTNNVTESWHRKIYRILKKKSNILLLLAELKEEALGVNFSVLQNELRTDIFRKRHQKYIDMDVNIEKIVTKYLQSETDLKACINSLSYLKY